MKGLKKLCTPSKVYFVVSILSLIFMMLSNFNSVGTFCMGNYDCPVDNIYLIYVLKIVYIAFITIVLDSLCKNGYASISWFLVFFPIMFYFVVLGLFMISQNASVVVVEEKEY